MLTVFWDSQGPILKTCQERGTTVTSATYCDMLQRELKPAICSKRRGKLSKEILLLHDARPHTAAHTLETLKQWKWEAMEHPPYTPDLAPSDFHLFRTAQRSFKGKTIFMWWWCESSGASVATRSTKSIFCSGITKLVGRWEKCIVKQGDYIEKRCSLLLKFLINRVKKNAETFWRTFVISHLTFLQVSICKGPNGNQN